MGKTIIKAEQEQRSIREAIESSENELRQVLATDVKQETIDEPVIEHPDEPALHVKVKVKSSGMLLENVESDIAEASNLVVVSDAFERYPLYTSSGFDRSEAELKDVLERFASSFNYNWEKHGSAIELRDKKWYNKRLLQIPQSWIDRWAETLKKTGTLDISELSQIATLTMEQFMLNIFQEEPFNRLDLSVIFGNGEFLKSYAALNESQRALIFTEMGLSLRDLPQTSLSQMEKLIRSQNASFLENPDAQIVMIGTRKQKDKQFEYSFKMTTTDDLKPLEWQFTTPKYIELKPKTEQNEGNATQEGNK